jgi:lipid-A-disaccharide synthase
MVNIMGGREIVREFLQEKALPGPISAAVLRLAVDAAERERVLTATERVLEQFGGPGASRRASEAVLAELGRKSSSSSSSSS